MNAMETLETTTIQKLENLLLVTVPRDLTDSDVLRLRREVLHNVRRHHSRWVLLDFSRVDICDSFFGRFIHSENMTIADWKIKAGSRMPEHTHPHEQVAYLLEGRFELTLEGETRLLTPGTLAVIPSNAPHTGTAVTDCHLVDVFHPVREDLRESSNQK